MSRRDEWEGEDYTGLLSGLDSAPVPEGMARRAVDRWAREHSRSRSAMFCLVTWPRVVLAASLLLLVLVARTHRDHSPRPVPRTQTAGLTPPDIPAPPPKGQRGRQAPPTPRVRVAGRRPPAPPSAVRTRTVPEAPAPTVVSSVADDTPAVLVGSAADMTYLNGEAPAEDRADNGIAVLADLRLETPVSLLEAGDDVTDVMGVLRGRTGVDIALPDEVARMRLALLCKERPLREVLRQMGRAMGIRWVRSGVGYASRYQAEPGPTMAAWSEERPGPEITRRDLQQLAAATGLDVIGDPGQVQAALEGTACPAPMEGWLVLSGAR